MIDRPTYPADLPGITFEGYGESPAKVVIRSTVDVGIAKQRSRTTGGARAVTANVKMTKEQVQDFDEFFVDTLTNGAIRFNWVNPRTKAVKALRFTDVPKYAPVDSVYYTVTMPLEILP